MPNQTRSRDPPLQIGVIGINRRTDNTVTRSLARCQQVCRKSPFFFCVPTLWLWLASASQLCSAGNLGVWGDWNLRLSPCLSVRFSASRRFVAVGLPDPIWCCVCVSAKISKIFEIKTLADSIAALFPPVCMCTLRGIFFYSGGNVEPALDILKNQRISFCWLHYSVCQWVICAVCTVEKLGENETNQAIALQPERGRAPSNKRGKLISFPLLL